jgi:hypothetical protein
MEGITILVFGGRKYFERTRMYEVLDEIHRATPVVVLVNGDAPGADSIAQRWAREREIDYVSCPAKWNTTQPRGAAGPIRNSRMLKDWGPFDLAVAFPGGTGTADMARKVRAAGVPIKEVV